MLWVYADRYGLDLPGRRHTFKATGFSHALADDHCSGTVTLQPETTVLRVGEEMGDYNCVRIFHGDGHVVGTMMRLPDGRVTWSDSCANWRDKE